VLKNVDFEAQPGQTIAFVGRDRLRKTASSTCLPRFYDPTREDYDRWLRYPRCDARFTALADWHRVAGNYLVAGTIGENIAFGKPEATMDEVIAAAKAAAAHDSSWSSQMDMRRGWASAAHP